MVTYTAPAATTATSQTAIVHQGCRAHARDMRCVNPPVRSLMPAGLVVGKAQITIVNANMICSMPPTPPARNRTGLACRAARRLSGEA